MADTVELCPFFNDYCGCGEFSCDAGGSAEDEFPAGVDVSMNRSVDFRNGHIYSRFGNLSAVADDERAIGRGNVPGEIPINAQQRFEAYLASKVNDISNKAQPIVLWQTHSLAAFFASLPKAPPAAAAKKQKN